MSATSGVVKATLSSLFETDTGAAAAIVLVIGAVFFCLAVVIDVLTFCFCTYLAVHFLRWLSFI